MINLSAAGLNPTEAHVYQVLLSKKEWKPAELAKNVGESRTNMYKILDKLTALELAIKFDKNNKIHYRAANPTRLVQLAQEHRAQLEQSQKELETSTQNLLSDYIRIQEQPGIRHFQGKEQIANIFQNISCAKTTVNFVHTTKGQDFYGYDTMNYLRLLAPSKGVKRRALTPDSPKSQIDYKETDPLVLLERTWLDSVEYTAPVEWGVYDDTVYIISYSQEAIGLTIESESIAKSFRQLFTIIEKGQKRRSDYSTLPKKAKQMSQPYAIKTNADTPVLPTTT